MLRKESKYIKYNSFRFGTISGVSKGINFLQAVNKFCFNAAISENICVYKTALNQYRPLSLKDAFKVFKFCIEKNFFVMKYLMFYQVILQSIKYYQR